MILPRIIMLIVLSVKQEKRNINVDVINNTNSSTTNTTNIKAFTFAEKADNPISPDSSAGN